MVLSLGLGFRVHDLDAQIPQFPSLVISSRFDRKAEKASGDAFDFSAEYVTPRFHTILTVRA